jgi:hypothetical protein
MKIKTTVFMSLFFVFSAIADSSIVPTSKLKSWGYRTKSTESPKQTKWEKNQFGKATIFKQQIKGINEYSKGTKTYYRFTLTKETYQNYQKAQDRIKKLFSTPPGVSTKMYPELVLREGFAVDKVVYIVSTDVMMFSYKELPKVTKLLKEYKK